MNHIADAGTRQITVSNLGGDTIAVCLPSDATVGDLYQILAEQRHLTHVQLVAGEVLLNERSAALPEEQHLQYTILPDCLYAIGGYYWNPCRTVECFDFFQRSWSPVAPMPTARAWLAAATLNGQIYTLGGLSGEGDFLRTVECFDTLQGSWTAAPSLCIARAGLATGVLCGRLCAVGGENPAGVSLNAFEMLDPREGKWQSGPVLPTCRRYLAVAVVGEQLYALGGLGSQETLDKSLRVVESYDARAGLWTEVAVLNAARGNFAAAVLDGQIYAIGGEGPGCVSLASVERWLPGASSWETIASLPVGNTGLTAEVLDGELFAIGGSHGIGRTVMSFDARLEAWKFVARLPTPRYGLGGAVAPTFPCS